MGKIKLWALRSMNFIENMNYLLECQATFSDIILIRKHKRCIDCQILIKSYFEYSHWIWHKSSHMLEMLPFSQFMIPYTCFCINQFELRHLNRNRQKKPDPQELFEDLVFHLSDVYVQ